MCLSELFSVNSKEKFLSKYPSLICSFICFKFGGLSHSCQRYSETLSCIIFYLGTPNRIRINLKFIYMYVRQRTSLYSNFDPSELVSPRLGNSAWPVSRPPFIYYCALCFIVATTQAICPNFHSGNHPSILSTWVLLSCTLPCSSRNSEFCGGGVLLRQFFNNRFFFYIDQGYFERFRIISCLVDKLVTIETNSKAIINKLIMPKEIVRRKRVRRHIWVDVKAQVGTIEISS